MVYKILAFLCRELAVSANGSLYAARTWFAGAAPIVSPGTVAVVRLDRIGDFVLFTPALARFRRLFPGATVCLVGSAAWRDLALWLNDQRVLDPECAVFDAFEAVDPERLARYGDFARAARLLAPFETVISAAFSRTNIVDSLVATVPGHKVASEGDSGNMLGFQRRLNNRRYDTLLPASAALLEYDRNLDLADALMERDGADCLAFRARGGSVSVAQAPVAEHGQGCPCHQPPRWAIPAHALDAVLAGLAQGHGEDLTAPYVTVSPFTSGVVKQWPLDRFAKVINRLLTDMPHVRVVLLGGKENVRATQRLFASMYSLPGSIGRFEHIVDLVGKTTLVELTAILARANVSLSGDTAAGHIASAVGTNNVVILGGGHYGRFFPYASPWPGRKNVVLAREMECFHCNWICKFRRFRSGPAPCVEAVPVEEAYDAVAGLLSEAP